MSLQPVNGSNIDEQLNLLNVLRKLWSDQDIWIRSFIQGKDTESDDLQAVAVELLRNAEQLANVLRQFYGDETANSFDRLLSYHVFITFQVIDAIKKGFPRSIEQQRERWYDAADDIAQFLSEINPIWQKAVWQEMLYNHMNIIENVAVLIFTNQFQESIDKYYEMQNESLRMGDIMAYGLIEQFLNPS